MPVRKSHTRKIKLKPGKGIGTKTVRVKSVLSGSSKKPKKKR